VQKHRYKFSMKPGMPLVSWACLCVAKDARNAGLHYSLKAAVAAVLLGGASGA